MIIVIGGGPAGFFAAITARDHDPACPVVLLEKRPSVLGKVAVSGGGRCNVTHACFAPRDLVANYPRGHRELLGPFHKFGPAEMQHWFAAQGVALKTEADGRMFPTTDDSATIVDCLTGAARQRGVDVRTRCPVAAVQPDSGGFTVRLQDGHELTAGRVLLATGGKTSAGRDGPDGYRLARDLGHTLLAPVPSLFTFRCDDPLLAPLAGVSVTQAEVRILSGERKDRDLRQTGPVLVTHRGLSGPAVLRMSAWGARRLHELDYRFDLEVNWLSGRTDDQVAADLLERTRTSGKQQIGADRWPGLPRRLWAALVARAGVAAETRWADLDRRTRSRLVAVLKTTRLAVTGQDTFKEEFVTCGGVSLKEVDMRTMGSRVCPGLFLAGEILDIDGITGGFNFQSCWTTGYLAGRALAGLDP